MKRSDSFWMNWLEKKQKRALLNNGYESSFFSFKGLWEVCLKVYTFNNDDLIAFMLITWITKQIHGRHLNYTFISLKYDFQCPLTSLQLNICQDRRYANVQIQRNLTCKRDSRDIWIGMKHIWLLNIIEI